MRKRIGAIVLFSALAGLAGPAAAALNVFACEPEWASLTEALAGDKASIYAATTAQQDVHRVEARPGLIARVRRADLLVCTGADLEAGWLPMLLRQSGNRAIQTGRPGHFLAADQVDKLDVPVTLDRAMGDVHPYGNPHIHTDPRRIGKVAEALAARLAEVDPGNADVYEARYQQFAQRWQESVSEWERRAAPIRGMPVVVDHRAWIYLFDWLGIEEVGAIEPKPGLPPSAGHLAGLKDQLAKRPAKAIVRAAHQDPRPAQWLSEKTGIPVVPLPYTVGGTPQAQDLFGLFDDTIARLLEAAQ